MNAFKNCKETLRSKERDWFENKFFFVFDGRPCTVCIIYTFFFFLISTKRDPRLYGIMWIHWIARDFYRRLGIGIFFFVFCVGGANMVFQVISVKKIWKSKGGTCPPSLRPWSTSTSSAGARAGAAEPHWDQRFCPKPSQYIYIFKFYKL